ncbi:MAG: FtsX-like permease family protein, partial [Bryobacterales bacterium]|nr:FtsX-like permease family protein [Bryobacterales bacterium]
MLVRTEGRAQELAVRTALGAGRGRVARELLVESLLLALAGGVAGIAFATAAVKLILEMTPVRLPRFDQIAVDGTAVLFTLALSIIAGLAFGAFPVWKHGGIHVSESLRAGGRTVSASRDRNFARNMLTVVQVALALVLLIGSGLMIRTFQSMRRVHPGFREPETLQSLRISIPRNVVSKDPELLLMQQNLVNRLAALPGVTAASMTGALPMTGASSQDPIAASDRTYPAGQIPPLRRFFTVGPGAFQAMGSTLAAGREYTWSDIHEKRQVVLISESFAREYWGSAQAAIGKQIKSNPNDKWSEIIGVVSDIRFDGVEKKPPSAVFWPQRNNNSMVFLVRTARAGSESFLDEVRKTVWAVNGSLPVTEVRTMGEIYKRSMSRTAFTLTLLAIS